MPALRLAVDLSGGTIRALEGVPGGPMRCGEAGVPSEAMHGGRIHDPAAVGATLRQLLARAEITTTRALIAAGDAIASFRVLNFPQGTKDADVDAVVKAQLPTTHERLSIRRADVLTGRPERTVYATAWDRGHVRAIAEAARHAGLDPAVVDLKSLCIARAVSARSCIVLDISSEPFEAILIDDHIPRVWHAFKADGGADLGSALFAGLKPVTSYYRNPPDSAFGPESPILVRSEQVVPAAVVGQLKHLTGRPVEPVPQPSRIDPDVRYGPFLTCVGLVMRRRT